jgi:hypothetical protein
VSKFPDPQPDPWFTHSRYRCASLVVDELISMAINKIFGLLPILLEKTISGWFADPVPDPGFSLSRKIQISLVAKKTLKREIRDFELILVIGILYGSEKSRSVIHTFKISCSISSR